MRRIYQIGNAEITRIDDVVLTDVKSEELIPQWSGERTVTVSFHAWLVRDRNRSILIGTAAGNRKPRPHWPGLDRLRTQFLENLREAGVAPEQIDSVLLTHLYADNIGWNTRWADGRWVPTFPNARYLFPKSDYDFLRNPANQTDRDQSHFPAQTDSLQPVIVSGQGQTFEADLAQEGFSIYPAPGHSPGHVAFVLRSDDRIAMFCGNSLQHPVQVRNPDWNCAGDALPEAAIQSRRRVIGFASDHDVAVFPAHFSGSSVGRIRRNGSGFLWSFM
jgi:glyoxylase-like metal-dependent hydrolase (beta-lactamase superfamily II)